MNKWWLLFLIASLAVIGFALVGVQIDRQPDVSAPSEKPARIVSLAPSITEILFELGLDKNIIAVSSDSDYPTGAADKIQVGTFWQPNTEAIIACKPDLVVTLDFEQQKASADTLSRLGYRVLTLKIDKIKELWISIQKIGLATGCRQRADDMTNNIKEKLRELQNKTTSNEKGRVLWVIQPEPLRVTGRNTFINELIELAGGENAIGPTIQQYPSISTEELLACGAEVIIQSSMDSDNIEQQQQAAELYWSKYPNLPAVKDKRIYVLSSDATLRLGPRLPRAVEEIGHCIFPEIFPNNPAEYENNK